LLDELVEKIDRLYFENVMVFEVAEEEDDDDVDDVDDVGDDDDDDESFHSLVVHMNVNDFSDIHFDFGVSERKKKNLLDNNYLNTH
jgi:outer membrane translocation and assembly module TamA